MRQNDEHSALGDILSGRAAFLRIYDVEHGYDYRDYASERHRN